MAQMDLSVALQNPYTLSYFDVLRRKLVVNNFGEGTVEDETFPGVYGVVYADGENKLDRRAESQSVVKTITVICKFALRTASGPSNTDGYQADVVVWNGAKFLVVSQMDWSEYGPGYIKALCTALPRTQIPAETSQV